MRVEISGSSMTFLPKNKLEQSSRCTPPKRRVWVNQKLKSVAKVRLGAIAILKYFLGADEKLDTMITCKAGGTEIITTDMDLYTALGSLKSYDAIQHAKLVKFLEGVDVVSYRLNTGNSKRILTHDDVEGLRRLALSKKFVREGDGNE